MVERPDSRAIRVGALAVVLGGATVAGGLVERPSQLLGFTEIHWWMLAALFALTEAFVLRLRMRGQGESVSLSELPLALGLFLAVPAELLIGRVVGSGLVFLLYHRQTLLKGSFNTSLVGAGTSAAIVIFTLLLGDGSPLGPRAWFAALIAVGIAGLLDGAILTLVVGWYDGGRPANEVIRELTLSTVVPILVGIGGIVSVVALTNGAAALPILFTGAAGLVGYRAFATLLDRHASLERLYELSDALAGAPGSADVLGSVLQQSLDLLRVEYSEVMLAGVQPDGVLRWSQRAGAAPEGPIEVPPGMPLPFPPPALRRVTGRTAPEQVFLAARGVAEAILVPLRVDNRVAGHLLVADRRGEERGFSNGDARLLETVANHASVALRNGQLIDRLHFEARHDELTGLPNRLFFRDLIDEGARGAAEDGIDVVVMVLDFDGFKAINDTLGHQAGDQLLRIISRRLQEQAGDDATVARLGGDEFAVISTRCAQEAEAVALAERLLTVFDEPVAISGTRLRLGGSLGIALGPRDGITGSDLMRNADIAMYAAKAGAGGARLFSKDLVEMTATALTLASDLRDAVHHNEVGVVFQPLIDLVTGRVHSVEVLARWNHPDLGEIAPEAFFAAAERSGQITALSARILDQALGLCRAWLADGLPVRVAVNLAPRWLADPSLPEQIGLALARHSVPAGLLCLEITESSVIADPRRAVETLGRLRGMGVHLSVDDFGTGYSSLTYLSRLPVDQMKIDKSFVQRLRTNQRDRAIVRSIVDLGRNLGLEVVAEGVTDPGTKRALQEMGCTLGQGYLFGRPMVADELPNFLVQTNGPDLTRALPVDTSQLLGRPPLPRESAESYLLPELPPVEPTPELAGLPVEPAPDLAGLPPVDPEQRPYPSRRDLR